MISLPANGTCPKCGGPIRDAIYEPHPIHYDVAIRVYDCPKCGRVGATMISLKKPTSPRE